MEKYSNKKTSAKALKCVKECAPNPEEGRFTVLLEDSTKVTVLGDSGSYHSALSSVAWNRLKEDVPDVESSTFSKPMQTEAVIGGSSAYISFTDSRDAEITLTIILPGSQLPVRIRGVRFLIIDQTMDEVLLGLPLLKALKFDLRQHLEQVRY